MTQSTSSQTSSPEPSSPEPSSSQTSPAGPEAAARRRRRRAVAVGGATLAAGLLWVAAQVLGIELLAGGQGGRPPIEVSLPLTAGMALVSAALGWGVLAVLERVTRSARTTWTWLAAGVFVLSLAMPLTDQVASAATKVVLLLMHVAVAAVVIPAFRRG